MGDTSRHEFFDEVNFACELYNYCKTFHVLPQPGGLFEQDAYYMLLLDFVIAAVNEKTAQDAEEARRRAKR
ncbi:hypothetical protein U27_02640 [Candidatus Vecturithrix granuli]|uniref:Uncharacterized protein n=1 Tax=Vecturithrix granuli TaxID=1499967 RepID=A0A081CB52_VECG1|nr:hypothetical protein U27_02640 [Candidatus Vecturithrix granuli]